MTHVFANIGHLIPQLPGWCTPLKAQALAASVIALRPELSLILGVFGGRDTLALALAHREIGKGKVIAIDPFSASASVQGQEGADRTWWSTTDHETIYRSFIEKVEVLQLGGIIEFHRMTSDLYDPPKSGVGILLVDGNHGPQAIKDVQRYAPSVDVGGLCYLDDLDWLGGNVRQALKGLLADGFREVYRIDQGIMLQRVQPHSV